MKYLIIIIFVSNLFAFSNTDSLKISKLENLINNQQKEIQSLTTEIKEHQFRETWFESELAQQTGIFTALITIFGIVVGASSWGYFKSKFNQIENKLEEFEDEIKTEINNFKLSINKELGDQKQDIEKSKEEIARNHIISLILNGQAYYKLNSYDDALLMYINALEWATDKNLLSDYIKSIWEGINIFKNDNTKANVSKDEFNSLEEAFVKNTDKKNLLYLKEIEEILKTF